jgi:UPF0716 family protein affecting phage T7 exclusion
MVTALEVLWAARTVALVMVTAVMGMALAVREDTAELLKMHKETQETLQAETAEVINNDRYNRE